MSNKQYAERDLMALDRAGDHYCRHIKAMTEEVLHSKSDIAAELAWRDARIAELEAITVVGDQVAGEDAERREWMARGVEKSIELISAHSWDESDGDGIVAATDAMEIIAAKIRAGEVE